MLEPKHGRRLVMTGQTHLGGLDVACRDSLREPGVAFRHPGNPQRHPLFHEPPELFLRGSIQVSERTVFPFSGGHRYEFATRSGFRNARQA